MLIAYNVVLSMVVKQLQMIPQTIHHIILVLQKTYLKIIYVNTRAPLNTKLKKNGTEFSNDIWDKKKDKEETSFKRYIKGKTKSYFPVTKRCM